MHKLKNRIISVFMAVFLAAFTSVCPVLNAHAFDISQRGVAFMVTAKSVLTAALAAAGTIAGGAYVLDQSQLTREEQIRIRNKIGALEDAYIAQQYAQADANLEMVEKTINGVKKNFPVVVGAVRNGVSYVAKSFLSDWYSFLNNINFFSGISSSNIDMGDGWNIGLADGYSYSSPVLSSDGKYKYSGSIHIKHGSWTDYINLSDHGSFSHPAAVAIFYDSTNTSKPYAYRCYVDGSVILSKNFAAKISSISATGNSNTIPIFNNINDAISFSKLGSTSSSPFGMASDSIARSYAFGLTNNLPVVGAGDIVFPKTWVGEGIDDLPFDGTTKEGLTVGAGDIPNAIPIDLGSDIPSLWEVGADVPSDVIANPADIPATGSLPWEIPDVGSIPFPIPGVAFPGAIPSEDEWPVIQDKVQTGEIDTDVPGVGDVAIEGFPIVGNIPDEKDVEDFSDKIFPWALDKLTLPDGLFDKIPFSIPRDIYWLMQAVTAQDIGGGTGQPDPSGTGVSGDVIAVDFTKSEIVWRSAPHIKGKWKFPLEKLGGKDVEVPIDIDCSQYDYFAALVWFGVAIIWTIVILRSILSSFASM